ncbi:MAG TPA: hypothetical protein VFZ65_01210 [Planctomycetota bacterium]|nr:hypothetical protein [Planctomycetota bacterium]
MSPIRAMMVWIVKIAPTSAVAMPMISRTEQASSCFIIILGRVSHV